MTAAAYSGSYASAGETGALRRRATITCPGQVRFWLVLQSPWSILAGMIAEAVITGYVTIIIHAHMHM